MKEIYIKARGKVNLNLEILDKRQDNYHNLKSVFQKINLYDEMFIKKINNNKLELQTNIESLNNSDNIIYKAYEKLKQRYKTITGVSVVLNKRIPMQAGLGGGSTDCASFIIAINKLFDLNLTKQEIIDIGKSLGADVVPCLYNTAVIGEGIGDIITKIKTDYKYYLVIIKPNISCSTKELFKILDDNKHREIIDKTDEIVKALQKKDIKSIAKNLFNRFEYVMPDKEIFQNIKEELMVNGAIGASMTGSGSCVFGLFENKQLAKKAYKSIKQKHEAYYCISYNSKKEEMF